MFMFLFSLFILAIFCIFVFMPRKTNVEPDLSFDIQNSQYRKEKIGAEVSQSLYNEVTSYCRKHHITISELIRKSVRLYMDTYK